MKVIKPIFRDTFFAKSLMTIKLEGDVEVETTLSSFLSNRALACVVSIAMFAAPIFAQGGNATVKTNTKVVYHDGPVMRGQVNAYLIWYGAWLNGSTGNDAFTRQIVRDFIANVGGTSYFVINQGYPDAYGLAPSGALIYSGETSDSSYLRGADLNPLSMQATPSDDFAADGIVNRLAWVLSTIVTNQAATGWFDRYGFENATKCQGLFGATYTTANGSRANIRLGQHDFLIQQNWVNTRKGYCSMAAPTQ